MPLQQFDERIAVVFAAQQDDTFNPATVMELVAQGSTETRVDQLLLRNTDTVDHFLTLMDYDGFSNAPLAIITVTAGSGAAGTAPLDAVPLVFGTVYQFYIVPIQHALRATWDAAPASGKFVGWVVKGGQF